MGPPHCGMPAMMQSFVPLSRQFDRKDAAPKGRRSPPDAWVSRKAAPPLDVAATVHRLTG
jgi:hypothetical protein